MKDVKDVRTLLVSHLCRFMLSMFKDTFANLTIAMFCKFYRNFEDLSDRKLVRLFHSTCKNFSIIALFTAVMLFLNILAS